MSTQLAVPNVETSLSQDMTDFAGLGDGRKFIPYIQLVAKTSGLVDKGAKPGTWAFIADKDNPENLGASMEVLCVRARMKAMHLLDNKPQTINYEKKSDVFQDIMKKAETAKYGEANSYMWGAEFLMWVPKAKNGIGCWGTYYMSSTTAKSVAKEVLTYLVKDNGNGPEQIPVQLTLNTKLVPHNKHPYYVPIVLPNSSVFSVNPTAEDFAATLTQFLNPPKDEREVAPETGRVR